LFVLIFFDKAGGNSADTLVAKGWVELAMNEDDSAVLELN